MEAIPSHPQRLRELVAGLDRKMFDAYNAHDVDGLMAMFSDDLEFYHDMGGLLDPAHVKAGFTNVFGNNCDATRTAPGRFRGTSATGTSRQGGGRGPPPRISGVRLN